MLFGLQCLDSVPSSKHDMLLWRAQALDRITKWTGGDFRVANTSQNIDRMNVMVKEDAHFPCITLPS